MLWQLPPWHQGAFTMQRRTFSLQDGLDMFLLDCEARRLTPLTITFYQQKLGVFLDWCDQHQVQDLNALTATDIRRFLVDVQRQGLSSQYQHNLARAIRAFLNYVGTSPAARQAQRPRYLPLRRQGDG